MNKFRLKSDSPGFLIQNWRDFFNPFSDFLVKLMYRNDFNYEYFVSLTTVCFLPFSILILLFCFSCSVLKNKHV